jgi:octaprenyl-diphosphate synthase
MSIRLPKTGQIEVLPDWALPIAGELESVAKIWDDVLASDVIQAREISMHLFAAGGKRIRPCLVMLSAGAASGSADDPRVLRLAAAVELMHAASLMHDDVVDQTHERRGVTTTNWVWGNKLSVLAGDYLIARAFSLVAQEPEPAINHILSSTAVVISESEILQAASEGSFAAWEANYDKIIDGKTARFLSACCECGAIAVGADDTTRTALAAYGQKVGLAFQITDDLLDVTGSPLLTGKDVGTDLTQGKFTLPILLALDMLPSAERDRMLELVGKRFLSAEEAAEAAALALECGATNEARAIAESYVSDAVKEIVGLTESAYTESLRLVARFVLERNA